MERDERVLLNMLLNVSMAQKMTTVLHLHFLVTSNKRFSFLFNNLFGSTTGLTESFSIYC